MIFDLSYNLWEKVPGWIAVIGVSFAVIIMFHQRSKKAELPVTKKVITGYMFFILGFAICRILFLISDFERDINDVSRLYTQIVLLGYVANVGAFLWLARIIEKHLLLSKRMFTTKIITIVLGFIVIMFIISIFYFTDLIIMITRYTVYAMSAVSGLVVLAFYFKLIFKTTGVVQKKFILSLVGICVMFSGIALDSELFTNWLPIFIPPIITIVGMIIFSFSQRKED